MTNLVNKILGLNKFHDLFNSYTNEDFIIGKDDFKDVIISDSQVNGFWYFKNIKKGLIKRFILQEGPQSHKVCSINLIKSAHGKFSPRFDFSIISTTNGIFEKYHKGELDENFIKAKVNFDSCHENFLILVDFIRIISDQIEFPKSTLAVVEKEQKDIFDHLSKDIVLRKIVERFGKELTEKDIDLLLNRREKLNTFKRLLEDKAYFNSVKIDKEIASDEILWQRFFSKNQWIFGYGLDYRFQGILQKEFHASPSEADGSNYVIGDFLLGDNKFTTFVEIKKPETPIFGKSKNRSNSWQLSQDLIDAVSQILEQKASGQLRLESIIHDSEGNEIRQKSYDSKTVLIIGSWRELEECDNDLEKKIKQKTFELFRRDSRNIEIITYDELFERAIYIIEGHEN